MCGRFALANIGQLSLRFNVDVALEDLTPRFNVAPSQRIPVIVGTSEGHAVRWMRWGYPPARWADGQPSPPPINARKETLLQRPLFRPAVTSRRCLVPADGFYEWRQATDSRERRAHFIRLKSGNIFAFAGLYAESRDEHGRPDPGCAIITTTANFLVAPIHHRMPAILDRNLEVDWLDPNLTAAPAILNLLQSYPGEEMEVYPVSNLVSSYRNEGPELIQRDTSAPVARQAALFT
jgi:putative SOS response-associated peptidase YedK